jgi:HD-like signal output (HDOD) protein
MDIFPDHSPLFFAFQGYITQVIKSASEYRCIMGNNDSSNWRLQRKEVIKKITSMEDFPRLPAPHKKLLSLLLIENINLQTLIDYIEINRALVANILKLINTGNYSTVIKVNSIKEALEILGPLTFKQTVYSGLIFDFYPWEDAEEWNHVYSASMLMTKLVEENESITGTSLILCALVHDIGKILLKMYNYTDYQTALALSEEKGISAYKAELSVFKVNHAETGGVLLKKWFMPDDLLRPVFFHHLNTLPKDHSFETAMLQFVNWIDSRARGIICEPPNEKLIKAVNFDSDDIDYFTGYQKNLIESLDEKYFPRNKIPENKYKINKTRHTTSFSTPLDTDTKSRLIDTATRIFKRNPGKTENKMKKSDSTQVIRRPARKKP